MDDVTVEFPIELKYYRIIVDNHFVFPGTDKEVSVYAVINKNTGVREAEEVSFPDLYEHALGMDRNMHRAMDFYVKNDNHKHLEGSIQEAEEERDAGLLVPAYMKPPVQ